MPTIVIQIESASLTEAAATMAGGMDTEALMSILSKRLEAQGRTLMVHDKDVEAKQPGPPPSKKTNKVTIKNTATVEAAAEAAKTVEEAKTAEEGNDFDDAVVEGADVPSADKPTIVDVRAALDKFRTDHGLVTARTIMLEVGGSSKLVEIDAVKYAPLLAALARHTRPAA